MSVWQTDIPHRGFLGPAACLCAACRVKIGGLRCRFVASGEPWSPGERCGNYRGHRSHHTRLIATVFLP
jgi:hypothetical protein